MRKNLPVTQIESPYPSGQTIVSVTDAKGRITYCNPTFIQVSGYVREELLGQPHNILRHPDMPAEAFRDLWETVQLGLPWTGVVKNRCKNGSYYWVRANVTPVVSNSQIVGYLSVRTEPERSVIEATSALYTQMMAEEESGRLTIRVHRGRVVIDGAIQTPLRMLKKAYEKLGGTRFLAIALASSALIGVSEVAGPWWSLPLAVVLAAGLSIWERISTESKIGKVVTDALQLAAGDLTHNPQVDEGGSLGLLQSALLQLALNLRTVIMDTRSELAEISSVTSEISAGNNDMSARTESQASSLEETAASMEEITVTVRNTAGSASHGAQLASEAAKVSHRSNAAVKEMADAMERIKSSSSHMQEIIQTIEAVAFQTNILALNAAVEAARAGEAGRGFAVVASEVRALAQRSAEAAKEIRQLIVESAESVDAGASQVDRAKASVSESLDTVEKVSALLGEINVAASEQHIGVTQVNESVAHMDTVTQQNAAMVEELAAAASSLESQVKSIANTFRLFKLLPSDITLAEVDAVNMRKEAKTSSPPSVRKMTATPVKVQNRPLGNPLANPLALASTAKPVTRKIAPVADDGEWDSF